MRINIFKILKTKTISHSSITLLGTFLNGVLGLLFFLLLARSLGPGNFGLVSVSIAFLTLIADIADVGINTGLINFVSRYWQQDREKSFKFMKLGLEIKLVIGVVVVIIGLLFISPLTTLVFLKPELTQPLSIAVFGVISALLFSFTTNILQAIQKFWSWSLLNIFSNGLRLLLIIVLLNLGVLNVNFSLIIYLSIPLIGFLIGLCLIPQGFLKIKNEQEVKSEFFNYNKWVALAIIMAAVSARLDTFLSTRFLSLNQVGIYSVAAQLSMVLPQAVYAVAAVVAPKLTSFDTPTKAWNYLKKLQILVLGFGFGGLLAIPAAYYFIPLVYGINYQASFLPFAYLWIAQLIFFISIPAHQAIFYYFSKPKIFSLISLLNLILVLVVGITIIPTFGVIGAALTILIGNCFNFLIPTIWVLVKFKKVLNEKK